MRNSTLAAMAVVLVLILWMASGLLSSDSSEATGNADDNTEIMTVEVSRAEPSRMDRTITLQGQLEPQRQLAIRAETQGTVQSLSASRGDRVQAGDLLLTIDMADRESDLGEAQARVRSALSEQKAASSLKRQGLQSQVQLEQANASLASAQAQLARIQRDLDHTRIRAPFDGVVNDIPVEAGELVSHGDVVAQLIDDSRFKVSAQVAQQSLSQLKVGQALEVTLITGETLPGKLAWISAVADQASRSFAIEATVDNPDKTIAAGVSASVRIPVEQIDAVFISPSTLSLGDDGELGVKIVNADNRVEFVAVDIVSTDIDGAWVEGIEAGSQLIVLGQGFVNTGEIVKTQSAGVAN